MNDSLRGLGGSSDFLHYSFLKSTRDSEKTYWTSVPRNWAGPRQLEINKGR